jgi:hypothetical protein
MTERTGTSPTGRLLNLKASILAADFFFQMLEVGAGSAHEATL